jgi:hypothetical protein
LLAVLILTGCGPGLDFNNAPDMTPKEMLERSSHVFVGVIERQQYDNWPLIRVPGDEDGYWKVLRRRIRVEGVFRGVEPQKRIDIVEISWTGGATGDCNLTDSNRRYLFLVRVENGRYHVVRDWWRSIFEVRSGHHDSLPLTNADPFWERVALMMWWVKSDHSPAFGDLRHTDPGQALTTWRTIKILRGLVRHPAREVRLSACETLLHWGAAQDECWDQVDRKDRKYLNRFHNVIAPGDAWSQNRRFEQNAKKYWLQGLDRLRRSHDEFAATEKDQLRLMTTIRDEVLRRQFCTLYQQTFPTDTDHGCPAGHPRPATIVTENGDIPLVGDWPTQP